GDTMRNNGSVDQQRFLWQKHAGNTIVTAFKDARGIEFHHTIEWLPGRNYLICRASVINHSASAISLDMLESFSISMLSPFMVDDGPDRLKLHRYHSFWSAEGRHEENYLEDIGIENSWSSANQHPCRFGQTSSMVVKGFFPSVGLEDVVSHVTWAAQLATLSAWQLQVCRLGDYCTLSGGCPDAEFANWSHTVEAGERFDSVPAVITCVAGDMQSAQNRLLPYAEDHRKHHPASESDMPVVYNEYCTTYGLPTEKNLRPALEALKGTGVRYFVMDAGWFRRPRQYSPGIGDWRMEPSLYPSGFDRWLDDIREAGMIPGIWFEFENISRTSQVFQEHPDWLITVDGHCYEQCIDRYFLDFRKPEVWAYLDERVVGFLREHKIGYVKVDYNALFAGADTTHGSAADGLREALEAVGRYYEHLRDELPELVVEVCASGGHRLTAGWMAIGDMASFSDAHETESIPIVAANVSLQIPYAANQIWATLRTGETPERTLSLLTGGFLGRLCLSGDVANLSEFQRRKMLEAIALYQKYAPMLRNGTSRVEQHLSSRNWNVPRGYQIFRRDCQTAGELVVVHTFRDAPATLTIPVGRAKIVDQLSCGEVKAKLSEGNLVLSGLPELTGVAIFLR
ncbi:MAG: alpha-galactosidase, partial [Victivallaceae bacterium]|nr:alpha-galactosidase [Victivallaceae bacterium]